MLLARVFVPFKKLTTASHLRSHLSSLVMFDERLHLMLIFNMLFGMIVVFWIFYWWADCFPASDTKQTIEIHFGSHTVIMRTLDMMQRRHEWHSRFDHENVRFNLHPAASPSFSSLWLQTCCCQTDHTLMICHEGKILYLKTLDPHTSRTIPLPPSLVWNRQSVDKKVGATRVPKRDLCTSVRRSITGGNADSLRADFLF